MKKRNEKFMETNKKERENKNYTKKKEKKLN